MRQAKQSDSPSGYCRDVYPIRRPTRPRGEVAERERVIATQRILGWSGSEPRPWRGILGRWTV